MAEGQVAGLPQSTLAHPTQSLWEEAGQNYTMSCTILSGLWLDEVAALLAAEYI
ncbi:MAG: hypothetical protein JO202_12970 [Ktedonobacteraceae bacterium]|nr:hypothetical protein [Ktedonobacteraceae bacterium]